MALKDYPQPSVTVDIIIFSLKEKKLQVLLVKRDKEPFKGKWALPGGFVRIDESLEEAAKRELHEETGIKEVYLEQLYTFGGLKRDPRGRVITVGYFALISSEDIEKIKLRASADVSDVRWFSMQKLPELSFDHDKILAYALKRLKWKFEYTTVAFSFLPKKFTLTQLQEIYEIVLNKELDKRNFRKKILSLGILKTTKEKKKDVSHRPPELYTFTGRIGEIVEIISKIGS
ncbi:NUDIX hydrolase [Candidatus Pacearchaeota archaeon]|nr:NUDIX hydrolase [Candidatus Pacearchaeota archaeon]